LRRLLAPAELHAVDPHPVQDHGQQVAAIRIGPRVNRTTTGHPLGKIVQPVVERAFGWLNRARRLANDFETLVESSQALALLSTYLNWAVTLASAAWAAGSATMPIAAGGHLGTPDQELILLIGLRALNVAMFGSCSLVLLGLRETTPFTGICHKG
jgi:hypothetical protein